MFLVYSSNAIVIEYLGLYLTVQIIVINMDCIELQHVKRKRQRHLFLYNNRLNFYEHSVYNYDKYLATFKDTFIDGMNTCNFAVLVGGT